MSAQLDSLAPLGKVPQPVMSRSPAFIDLVPAGAADLGTEIVAGLRLPQAQVSPKFLYDRLGSALFVAITELDEYYPTRTEAAIFDAHGAEIAAALHARLGHGFNLIDLGAGDSVKAARLFPVLQPARYLAIDISTDFLRQSLEALQRQHPSLPMTGIAMDFSARLALPPGLQTGRSAVFYPGSSIGNFAPEAAQRLLVQAREAAPRGALLIGADMVKPAEVLEAAYDDALGVTAAFNLNLLRHLNAHVGADFQPRAWQHRARFDAQHSRIEMHLHARAAQTVHWQVDGRIGSRRFEAGESIHTENSYKWTPEAFTELLRSAGWRDVQVWQDPKSWFGVFLAFS